jgi:hypothetical protein
VVSRIDQAEQREAHILHGPGSGSDVGRKAGLHQNDRCFLPLDQTLFLSDAARLPWQRAGAFFPLAPDLVEIVRLRALPLGLSIWYGMSGGKKRRAVRKTRGDAVGLLRKRRGRWKESSQTTPF